MPLFAFGSNQPRCAPDSWVAETATLIGAVVLESGASVFFGAVLRGDNDLITVGEGSNIQDNAMLHTDAGIRLSIGRNVTVGHQAMLHGCSIGDGSLIGVGAVILNHAKIGRHCLVAAGSIVPERKAYPERSLILGAPAKVVRELGDEEVNGQLLAAQEYVRRWKLYVEKLKRIE